MGAVCTRFPKEITEEPQQEQSEMRIMDISGLEGLKFEFTCQRLTHLSGDLLVLFMNHNTEIKRNDHFKTMQPQAKKIEEYAQAYIANHQLQEQYQTQQLEFITFDVQVPNFDFKKVSLLFCDLWKEEAHNDTAFRNLLKKYFSSIKQESFKSVSFTEFESNLGVHLQKGAKRLLRQIVKMPNKPQQIEFVCLNPDSKGIFLEETSEKKEELLLSFTSSHNFSNAETDYF